MLGHRLRFPAAILLALFLGCALAAADDLPANTVIQSFVKIEPHEAHLVVRIPIDLLGSFSFPMKGDLYDVAAAGPQTRQALGVLAEGFVLRENGVRLVPSESSGHLSPGGDRSFKDYGTALAETAGPPDLTTGIANGMGFLDAHLVYPISSPQSVFTLQSLIAADLPGLTKLELSFMPLADAGRSMVIPGGAGPAVLNPTWRWVVASSALFGVRQGFTGIGYILLLLCLLTPFGRLRGLIPVFLALSLGQSFTLIGSGYHLEPLEAWFLPFVKTAIACSIFYVALENIVGASLRRRWLIAGLFGLPLGFEFFEAFTPQLPFSGTHLLASLFSFSVGVVAGQLLVLAVMLPALALFRRIVPERMGVIILSAIVAHTAWHWMIDRGKTLWETPWPPLSLPGIVLLARWAAAFFLAVVLAGFISKWIARKWPSLLKPGSPAREEAAASTLALSGVSALQPHPDSLDSKLP
jgi:HupE / UreJ protein